MSKWQIIAAGLLGALMAQPESAMAIDRARLQETKNLQNTFQSPRLGTILLPCMTLQQKAKIQEDLKAVQNAFGEMQTMLVGVASECRRREALINQAIQDFSVSGERVSSIVWSDNKQKDKFISLLQKTLENLEDNRVKNKDDVADFRKSQFSWEQQIAKTQRVFSRRKNTPDGDFMLLSAGMFLSSLKSASKCLKAAEDAQDDLMLASRALLALFHLPAEPVIVSSAEEMGAALDALWA
ncbi:hypothetical protein APA22_22920 [Acetobacter pasteurianus IFO 3283-22]|uniref:Uncharacterized protein n=2 Tax=Acetobacter pasteurianus TaxID=438 RepID=C7JF16_ACEP3|nr:hypothetical protein [Acetobacter pasteurianus]BAI00406.1 hypothetical protein APA01_22920 [Acetobacter pasteurianus IFO 3283-01]BAI03457.1 hypothetical protein APA03_22920 [Acetobacter pasteurianus IFO 3283-03]BAI06502.1 hypothetical protein APA07_22920 [Acetobacter pasteurianus IFO 3283-07]BAI09552.1 hypothetical protein APA22_22920 [Acetobacter pasteurianus IFO 3283-22]BAI12600.1 hypothetical protein APA26_22920 [Acetobacter pasteurianus IFO 3283-26]BAI15646.1 hypothetical protein APA32